MRRASSALAVCLLVVVAGCGGGGGGRPDRFSLTTPRAAPPPASHHQGPAGGGGGSGGSGGARGKVGGSGPITAREKAVVRGWSDALRHGQVERAVGYWDVPAIASNGGQPVRLLTRRAIRFWNTSLPCGARLVGVERDSNYVLATFVLTERPGKGQCGSGVGHRARTLFLLRGNKIVQWLRAADPQSSTDVPGGTTS